MTTAPDHIESGRKLFATPATFMLGVAHLKQLPLADKPEIACAGRSNVGKSSLINAVTNQKSLAKTSNTPGRTQQLNFFNVGEGQLYFVDMPGYGYAKVSKAQKEEWNALIKDYLRGRQNLRCVLVLIDARHGIKENDTELMALLDETAVPYRIVLTKTDKVKNQALEKTTKDISKRLKTHPAAFPEIHATSAEKNFGLDELKSIIYSYL
ncbi:MAG: ribosome biogenesis GTP-binding protein YihA/YsxC [Pseudomonadota bacterium]